MYPPPAHVLEARAREAMKHAVLLETFALEIDKYQKTVTLADPAHDAAAQMSRLYRQMSGVMEELCDTLVQHAEDAKPDARPALEVVR